MSSAARFDSCRSHRCAMAVSLIVAAGVAAAANPAHAGSSQPFQLVVGQAAAVTTLGGQELVIGSLGVPSLGWQSTQGSRWSLAVTTLRADLHDTGNHILMFTNAGTLADAYAPGGGYMDTLPSAQVDRAAYRIGFGTIYSGNDPLLPFGQFGGFPGRPSAQGALIGHWQSGVDASGATGIIVHGQSGSSVLVNAREAGFDDVGRVSGLNTANDISIGRGGGRNVVFRGHSIAGQDSRNGIFVKQWDGAQPMYTVADNTMDNPLAPPNPDGSRTKFNFHAFRPETLPVGYGQGAAWATTDGGNAVLARSTLTSPIMILSRGMGEYGNVSAGAAGTLAYEVTRPGETTEIWQNVMGLQQLCVDQSMFTSSVVDLAMGSEAIARNPNPLRNPRAGAFSLGFLAEQSNPNYPRTAVYVKSISQGGVDFGGLFGANNLSDHGGSLISAQFRLGSGPESDHVTMSASIGGNAAFLGQNHGVGIGVASSGDAADGDEFLVNTTASGEHERLSIHADYDMTVDGMTFTSLDIGESVRFFLDGTLVMDATFEGNKASVMDGLQHIALDSLFVAAGSSFAIEHGGIGDGFAVSSMILNIVPNPSALSLFGLGGLMAIRRTR